MRVPNVNVAVRITSDKTSVVVETAARHIFRRRVIFEKADTVNGVGLRDVPEENVLLTARDDRRTIEWIELDVKFCIVVFVRLAV